MAVKRASGEDARPEWRFFTCSGWTSDLSGFVAPL